MLDAMGKLDQMSNMQKYALTVHCYNLFKGFKLTGYLEDDPHLNDNSQEERKSSENE